MTNPFDDTARPFLVLVNDEGQHSLWPEDIEVPAGWRVSHRGDRGECLAFVERHWTDMRPAGLVAEMDASDR
ncbi:MbtH protein [Stackebrandtia albiflava]|uniref:MbtH protein n=1 Tax=Stackebrandtia albiflava TaxID=406432 RepID=A0A562VBW4_9ACTN|nr:MbtH family protein [Stackebrandtia albiflava]TWJ15374.1 MbtH protein [Stackebrandtia albiflava]